MQTGWNTPPDIAQTTGSFNHYRCERCGRTAIAKHEDGGVTPYMLGCYATPGCGGTARSLFYRGSQDPAQQPHLIWWRAKTESELEVHLTTLPKEHREWVRDHHNNGGTLMRETSRSAKATRRRHVDVEEPVKHQGIRQRERQRRQAERDAANAAKRAARS